MWWMYLKPLRQRGGGRFFLGIGSKGFWFFAQGKEDAVDKALLLSVQSSALVTGKGVSLNVIRKNDAFFSGDRFKGGLAFFNDPHLLGQPHANCDQLVDTLGVEKAHTLSLNAIA